MSAKDIVVKPIKGHAARAVVQRYHYSGKTVQNSQIHFGVFYKEKLEGCLQFGSPIDRRKLLPLVEGSEWGDMIELNRMAFSDVLPRNSESRAIGICIRMMRKHYPQLKWIVSFADGTQCGDGTIYRASGFVLTAINKNSTIARLPSGEIVAKHGTSKKDLTGAKALPGYQLRYIYFIDKEAKKNLTVPVIPFSKIDELGAGMYKGQKRGKYANSGDQPESGGETPTSTLQSNDSNE